MKGGVEISFLSRQTCLRKGTQRQRQPALREAKRPRKRFDSPDDLQATGMRLAEQQGVAYAKTVAEAMDLKIDADNPADREKLRRAILGLVAGRKCESKSTPSAIRICNPDPSPVEIHR